MIYNLVGIFISLILILMACELFTNSIEWLGKKLGVGDGVVGSIFSAVGTCLPETMIPIIAIFFSSDPSMAEDVGIGAIVGAPFMLSTLAFFITGISVIIFHKKRKTGYSMTVNNKIFTRDVGFFIFTYGVGIFAAFLNKDALVRYLIAALLILTYLVYIIITVMQDNHNNEKIQNLYFAKIFKVKISKISILIQMFIAVIGIILGAELFVLFIENISRQLQINALILSLIITPIATELPEKFNSIIWILKNKDTLALGNITGAMVFQSCIPIAIGVLATSWNLNLLLIVNATLAILSAVFSYVWVKVKGELSPLPLIVGGALYTFFIIYIFL